MYEVRGIVPGGGTCYGIDGSFRNQPGGYGCTSLGIINRVCGLSSRPDARSIFERAGLLTLRAEADEALTPVQP